MDIRIEDDKPEPARNVLGELDPDGITWTERDSGKSNYLSGVTFSL